VHWLSNLVIGCIGPREIAFRDEFAGWLRNCFGSCLQGEAVREDKDRTVCWAEFPERPGEAAATDHAILWIDEDGTKTGRARPGGEQTP
jgi:hypothetical protein